ncbi:ABC transporter substrate-binding protein [Jiella marina]|uniref:ABC transporter substrate-binding protein n=1 Tax=Jiella sp. LLJ827 TaxID=2917712 RepID=UPI0021015F8F|nr:PotD/PotF family extracellular solute-binding protein [Jiella sp. LLJ827]MCQ0989777.1 PotD/PotF family extracellular solute-binding protein [Jiella sp. LLJ827]
MNISRRTFTAGMGALGAASVLGGTRKAFAQRADELNILCWEGYNTDDVLGPFREMHPDATVRAESGTSDPDMINKLRAGEVNVWDLINLNQPWARQRLMPEGLIKPLDKERFMPFFERMAPEFSNPPYPLAFSDDDELIGMPQRYGPFSFVVNTDKISRETAENEGWNIFLDPAMQGRYGVLTYDNWNLIHLSITAGINPFQPMDDAAKEKFREVATQIMGGATLKSADLVAMNTALINGEIDAYFTGGTYTASPARLDGFSNIRGITPASGPIDGKGGVAWIELTSLVNNPDPSPLAADFLEFVQQPEICKAVGFAEGTYNPVAQMGDPDVRALWNEEELDAIQWDSLEEEMARSAEYAVVADYDELMGIYTQARRA